MGVFKDLTGQQFNSITVLYYNKELSKKEHHTY
jgi:hypothetical protein